MRVKPLFEDKYSVVAVMDGDECPAEDFLQDEEANTSNARLGLLSMLEHAAKVGLDQIPRKWTHEANKKGQIYEFIKGPLRLFFFKGHDGQIAVCTSGVRKKGNKADPASVEKAMKWRQMYQDACANGTLTKTKDEDENEG